MVDLCHIYDIAFGGPNAPSGTLPVQARAGFHRFNDDGTDSGGGNTATLVVFIPLQSVSPRTVENALVNEAIAQGAASSVAPFPFALSNKNVFIASLS